MQGKLEKTFNIRVMFNNKREKEEKKEREIKKEVSQTSTERNYFLFLYFL